MVLGHVLNDAFVLLIIDYLFTEFTCENMVIFSEWWFVTIWYQFSDSQAGMFQFRHDVVK